MSVALIECERDVRKELEPQMFKLSIKWNHTVGLHKRFNETCTAAAVILLFGIITAIISKLLVISNDEKDCSFCFPRNMDHVRTEREHLVPLKTLLLPL